jgi:dsRNA-specific ribonuclease
LIVYGLEEKYNGHFLKFNKKIPGALESSSERAKRHQIFTDVLSAYMGAIMMRINSKYHMENIPKG